MTLGISNVSRIGFGIVVNPDLQGQHLVDLFHHFGRVLWNAVVDVPCRLQRVLLNISRES